MTYDVAIIGAGLVGLATAHRLQTLRPDWKVCLLEKEQSIALHQSSHNSGVIHSGIYYQPGSLRAKNCLSGYALLLEFCSQHQVPFEICGKLIVATEADEIPALEKIYLRGKENGLYGLSMLDREAALEIEPNIACERSIQVPQAGIIDFRNVALTLSELVEEAGGELLLGEEVKQIQSRATEVIVGTSENELRSRYAVSCAGLYADKVARLTVPDLPYRILPFRGEYYDLIPERKDLVNHLIYPVPNPNFPFLGVHFTRRLHGGVEAGPNAVLAFRREGYKFADFDMVELTTTLAYRGFRKIASKYWRTGLQEMRRSLSKKKFVEALQKLVPAIVEQDVVPGRSGVRAMACDIEGNLLDDFLILEDQRVIHMVNAPSPAATACLAIGRELATKILKKEL